MPPTLHAATPDGAVNAAVELVQNLGPPTPHPYLSDREKASHAECEGYHASDWVAYIMGCRKTDSQTRSLFHGTSLQSALKIHADGLFVFETSQHGGKSGIFGQSHLMNAFQYAKRQPPNAPVTPDLGLQQCPVVVEYVCDPDRDYVCPIQTVHMGKCLQTYNKKAYYRDHMFVWRAPLQSWVLGLGDGKVVDPSMDPVGITSVWLHVHKEILMNYACLDIPQLRDDITSGRMYLCRAHYTMAGQGSGTAEMCPEWTCGRVTADPDGEHLM